MEEISLVGGPNPTFMGFLFLSVAALITGLFFMGRDHGADKKAAMLGVTIVQKYMGIAMLLVAFFLFLTNPFQSTAATAWVASLFGALGFVFIIIGKILADEAEHLLISTILGASALLIGAFAGICFAAPGFALRGLHADFLALFFIASTACLWGALAIRNVKPFGMKGFGFWFVLVGLDAFYMGVRYLFAVMGTGDIV